MAILSRSKWILASLILGGLTSSVSFGGDFLSGTYLDPAQQRPDIFPKKIWNAWPEYRATYNRPRYIGGKIASVVEPTSQEAMAWEINKANGNYANHCGKWVPHYYYPKPWEVLNTRARPDHRVEEEAE